VFVPERSKVALAPIFILWFGYGLVPKVGLILVIAFFPVTLSMLAGMQSVDNSLLALMNSVGAGPTQILLRNPRSAFAAQSNGWYQDRGDVECHRRHRRRICRGLRRPLVTPSSSLPPNLTPPWSSQRLLLVSVLGIGVLLRSRDS